MIFLFLKWKHIKAIVYAGDEFFSHPGYELFIAIYSQFTACALLTGERMNGEKWSVKDE